MYRCRHCDAEITYLLFQESGTQNGDFYIQSGDYENTDFNSDDRLWYMCPECQHHRAREADAIYVEIENDEERPTTMPTLTSQSQPRDEPGSVSRGSDDLVDHDSRPSNNLNFCECGLALEYSQANCSICRKKNPNSRLF